MKDNRLLAEDAVTRPALTRIACAPFFQLGGLLQSENTAIRKINSH